jgi:hypothetical protein
MDILETKIKIGYYSVALCRYMENKEIKDALGIYYEDIITLPLTIIRNVEDLTDEKDCTSFLGRTIASMEADIESALVKNERASGYSIVRPMFYLIDKMKAAIGVN